MSKFLLNLLVQISKVLVYSKIQFLFGKEFFSVAFGPAATHLFSPSLQLSHAEILISECEPFFPQET
jgi:hypothetical protein